MQKSYPIAKVRKNHHGGVLVTHEDMKLLLDFLGKDVHGMITSETLRHALLPLFPHLSQREIDVLLGQKSNITPDELSKALIENNLSNYDPSIETFYYLDPLDEGCVNMDKLREVMDIMGHEYYYNDDLDILHKALDQDNDGYIRINDFRATLPYIDMPNSLNQQQHQQHHNSTSHMSTHSNSTHNTGIHHSNSTHNTGIHHSNSTHNTAIHHSNSTHNTAIHHSNSTHNTAMPHSDSTHSTTHHSASHPSTDINSSNHHRGSDATLHSK